MIACAILASLWYTATVSEPSALLSFGHSIQGASAGASPPMNSCTEALFWGEVLMTAVHICIGPVPVSKQV